jgi:hypothetical protein
VLVIVMSLNLLCEFYKNNCVLLQECEDFLLTCLEARVYCGICAKEIITLMQQQYASIQNFATCG